MPKAKWTGVDDPYAAAKIVGPRLRQLRVNRQLTIRDLAARANVSKNTVLRLEQGEPIAEELLTRICNKLQTILPNLLIPTEADAALIRVHRSEQEKWHIAFRRERAPKTVRNFEHVPAAAERARLGSVGFVSGFVMTHDSVNPDGRLQAATVELFGDQEEPGFRHSGEEFLYCLSGIVRLTVGEESVELSPGDSATFNSHHRHRYEAAGKGSAMALMVWYESPEDARSITRDDECEDHPD